MTKKDGLEEEEALAALDAEDAEWQKFKAEHTEADDEELHMVDGILATWAEHDVRLNNAEAKAKREKYEAELAECLRLDQEERAEGARAEAEATELAKKNWDASQTTAKAKCDEALKGSPRINRRAGVDLLVSPKSALG